jgi:hypothetical protein
VPPSLLALEGRRLLVDLESATASGSWGRHRLSAQGTIVARLLDRGADTADLGTAASTLDRGTTAITRRSRGAVATAATNRGSTTARAITQPPSSPSQLCGARE